MGLAAPRGTRRHDRVCSHAAQRPPERALWQVMTPGVAARGTVMQGRSRWARPPAPDYGAARLVGHLGTRRRPVQGSGPGDVSYAAVLLRVASKRVSAPGSSSPDPTDATSSGSRLLIRDETRPHGRHSSDRSNVRTEAVSRVCVTPRETGPVAIPLPNSRPHIPVRGTNESGYSGNTVRCDLLSAGRPSGDA